MRYYFDWPRHTRDIRLTAATPALSLTSFIAGAVKMHRAYSLSSPTVLSLNTHAARLMPIWKCHRQTRDILPVCVSITARNIP